MFRFGWLTGSQVVCDVNGYGRKHHNRVPDLKVNSLCHVDEDEDGKVKG